MLISKREKRLIFNARIVYSKALMFKICNKMRGLSFLTCLLFVMITGAQAWGDLSYTVKKGDSLYKISKKYKVGIEEIKKANNLKTKKLKPGKELTIPSTEDQDTAAAEIVTVALPPEKAVNVTSEVIATQPQTRAEPKTYKVKKGDSLWSIAKKHSITVSEIKELNNLKSRKLKPGQVIVIEKEPVDTEVLTGIPLAGQAELVSKYAEKLRELSSSDEPDYAGIKEFLISVAEKTLGIPYKFGASSFKATDCSGYVQTVFNLIGVDLPRSAREQFKVGQSVDRKDLSIGDLVFFQTYAPFPSHVGIYLGNNLFVHASSYAKKVTINSLSSYYLKRFIGAKRLEGLKVEDSVATLDNFIIPE
ncbi:MAG: peptidoglycan endopeptidase [Nitrospiraceae bacterium]|nr:MAG: peptidoglycan endopeptidase [Nitrospiraceae bacterium]